MTRCKRRPRLTSFDRTDLGQPEREASTAVRFLFVGERPSPRAEKIGATWQNGRLSGKTLREALQALHLDPDAHHYLNLYQYARSREDAACEEAACREIARLAGEGYTVVGLGRLVSGRLHARRIPHLRMVHPAARGAIRKAERYRAHVADTLSRLHRQRP